ncbi:MAG: asparagine synthase (glutamine-hydrolyzing) [Rhodospirillales bacterium]
MCGFAAFLAPERQFERAFLSRIDDDLFHRGPDSGGVVSEDGFALVFRRLSILDVAEIANQPMTDPSGNFTLVYNGEIYNYRQLRAELQGEGVRFRSTGDTEVLFQALMHWGVEPTIGKLEGMFAFVLIDRARQTAHAARDHFGIKPLYLRCVGSMVGLASEMRPLSRLAPVEIDERALAELMAFGWAAGSLSNLKGIERVEPGTLLRVSLRSGAIERTRFYDLTETLREKRSIDLDAAVEEADACIQDSLKAHLASDVGYTVQLSGGVDSSLLTALTVRETDRELDSFGVDLGDYEKNERQWREAVTRAYPLRHHEIPMGGNEFADTLPRAVEHMEGPVPHGGCVMLMRLCDELKSVSKVVIVGEGADEFFGGYERYALAGKTAWQERIGRLVPGGLIPDAWPFKGMKRLSGRDAAAWASVTRNTARVDRIFPGLAPVSGAREDASAKYADFVDRLFAVDQSCYLESLLVRQDKMSMAASVEARVPFVHQPVAKIVNSLPNSVRAPGGITKPLLKKVAERYLPHDLVNRRKIGLVLPYDEWCRDPSGVGRYLELLTDSDGMLGAYADRAELSSSVSRFRSGDPSEDRYMFRLINIELWMRSVRDLARQDSPTVIKRGAA